MEMRIKEAIRYLGYGRHAVDDGTFALITEAFRELDQIKCAKSVYRIFDLQVKGSGSDRNWRMDSHKQKPLKKSYGM